MIRLVLLLRTAFNYWFLDIKGEILEDQCPKPENQQETPEAEKQKKPAPKEKEAEDEAKAAST